MNSELCRKFGTEFPLFAFSHCRDVVAEVSKAGGLGVLGAVQHTPEQLEVDLKWIDDHVEGKPYGIDLLIPKKMAHKGESQLTTADLEAEIPAEHRAHVEKLLEAHGIDTSDLWSGHYGSDYTNNMREGGASELLDVAFAHPIALFVNALGVPPASIIERCRGKGILVGALTGAREHALKHAAAGVGILVVSGTEAGGHCGEISTMDVVPDLIEAVKAYPGVHGDGRRRGVVRLGVADHRRGRDHADGEGEDAGRRPAPDRALALAHGHKPTRQLHSAWTDAWSGEGAPDPLPMPLQGLLSRPVMDKIDKLAAGGHEGEKQLATYYVGQAVGLMNSEQSVRSVVYDFMEDYAAAVERLNRTMI